MTGLDLDDIQGLILRGYRKDVACHLVLRIDDARAFKAMLGDLATEDLSSGPFITVATNWREKPPSPGRRPGERPTRCVNIGFTFDGLGALGLSTESLDSFPADFREGAVARALPRREDDIVWDDGPSAPAHWRESLINGDAHAIVSAYADTPQELADVAGEILARAAGAASEIDRFDAHRLGGSNREHFGYEDGLSQPTIEGVEPRVGIKDPFPPVPPGEFVLGQRAQPGHPPAPRPAPDALGLNGSFAAFRVMYQHVAAFEEFLTTESSRLGIGRELLAAKVCGRWRNGEPLVMRPPSAPAGTIPHENLNAFDYEATPAFPEGDHAGLLCPRGAHIRRAFPRSQRVIDDYDGLHRRIVRRAMPYGPEYDREHADDDRGMVGMFICASLEHQFEYMMRHWLNDGRFTGGRLGRSRDPLVGANHPEGSRFETPGAPRIEATGFPRFVTTHGCAYLFLPSMTALRHMAATG